MAWLPWGAALVDIYPYAFPVEYQSNLIHWIRGAMRKQELLHLPYEVSARGTSGRQAICMTLKAY
jgi:hypothetical protein